MSDFTAADGTNDGPSGPRAGFGERFVAALIDGVLLGILGAIANAILASWALAQLIDIVGGVAYYSYLEGSPSGQTLGKRAMNIRVVDLQTGMPIGTSRALVRYLGRFLSGIPCGLGYFWMLWDKEKQTWHDKLSSAAVVPTSAYPVEAWPG
jgi:uncharacterized RDD family membrane protein YckC